MKSDNTASDSSLVKLSEIAHRWRERPVWLRIGQLIDGVSDAPIKNANIVLDAQEIRFVGGNGKTPDTQHLAAGQTEPDLILDDCTAMPCLIEAHAHLFLDGAPVNFAQREQYLKESSNTMLLRAQARWPKILQCGIGAVRDAGDKHGVGLALARDAKKSIGKLATTPYIDSPGAAIHHRGRYGSFMGQPIEEHPSPAACVAARVADGADRIKLLATGIINFKEGRVTTPPQMSADEIKTLVEAARSHHRQTFAHASGADGVTNCIEGGVNTVEHGFFITPAQLAIMRDKGIAWVPTFAPVQLQIDRASELGWDDKVVANLKWIIESHQQMLTKAHEMGVKVVAGSDAGSCGVPHGIGFLQELQQMENAGMPAMAVLRSATSVSAQTLAFPEKIGEIAPGFRSRLIITTHDPAKTVANLQKEKSILFDGQTIHSDSIDTAGL